MRAIQPGDKVKFHGVYLRNTGQRVGGEGRKVWAVQACSCGLCESGDFVAVDERSQFALPGEPDRRHIRRENLYRVGTRVVENAG